MYLVLHKGEHYFCLFTHNSRLLLATAEIFAGYLKPLCS